MSLRIREDGRILCAAMHPEEDGDTYLHDGISYRLTVELRAIVTEPMRSDEGRGGHDAHGEWWWRNEVPSDVVLEGALRPVRRSWGEHDEATGEYIVYGASSPWRPPLRVRVLRVLRSWA